MASLGYTVSSKASLIYVSPVPEMAAGTGSGGACYKYDLLDKTLQSHD